MFPKTSYSPSVVHARIRSYADFRAIIIGERERANLMVQTARISTTVRRPTAHAPGLRAYFHCMPVIMSCVYTRVCSSVLSQSWTSPEKMPFVIEERGKENVVPVRLLSRERLVCISVACVIGNAQIFTRCLAVISMRYLASERTPVYSLAFAALFDTWPRLSIFISNLRGSKFQAVNMLEWLVQIQSLCARSRSPMHSPTNYDLVRRVSAHARLLYAEIISTFSTCACVRKARFYDGSPRMPCIRLLLLLLLL